jgi:hypothetical protein
MARDIIDEEGYQAQLETMKKNMEIAASYMKDCILENVWLFGLGTPSLPKNTWQ